MNQKIWTVLAILTLLAVCIYFLTLPARDDTGREPMLMTVRQKFSKLHPEFAKIPLAEGDSSYTDNKAAITLCLRDPKTNKKYSENTITYVGLHELAHVISKTHGHGDEFKKNFAILLQEATNMGMYDPTDPMPSNYCGLTD